MKEAYRNVSISFITLYPLREASYTKQKGEKMVDFLCFLKSKKTPVEEVEEKIKRKKKKSTKDEKRKKTFLFIGKENEKKKTEGGKLKRKLFFLRRASKKKKQSKDDNSNSNNKKKRKRKCNKLWRTEQKKGNNLVSLVKSISLSNGKHRSAADEILRIGSENIAARVFTYRELSAATANFSTENRLGEGGFGRVYKGQLKGNNEIVAVKLLDRNGCLGTRDFLVEILMLSLLHHPNLVKLLGYCTDGDQRVLVYEYMPMGSIEDQLLGAANGKKQPLDWHTRMKLAAEAAKGLEYLHEIANPPVIYKDFKASNVVLDENFNVKLSDFGLAKVSPAGDKNDNLSPRVMGTYGYCAPECVLAGQLTKMSDVYSFGVVLLQLITGRKAVDLTRPRGQQHLVHWAEPLFKDRRHFVAMADPQLKGKHPMKGLYQAIAIAAMCLQEEPTIRPLISDVFSALNYLANPKNDDDGDIPAASVATNTRASCGLEKVLHSAAMPSGSEIKQDEFVEPEEMKEARSCPEDDSFASIETGIK